MSFDYSQKPLYFQHEIEAVGDRHKDVHFATRLLTFHADLISNSIKAVAMCWCTSGTHESLNKIYGGQEALLPKENYPQAFTYGCWVGVNMLGKIEVIVSGSASLNIQSDLCYDEVIMRDEKLCKALPQMLPNMRSTGRRRFMMGGY